MLKRFLLILLLIILLPCNAAENAVQTQHAGTPPGFYDDIDPNSLEDDEENVPAYSSKPDFKSGQGNQSLNSEETEDDSPYIHFPAHPDMTIEQTKATKNYSEIYNNLEPADFSYLHNIDPDQYYDTKDAAWSVYPLFRLNSPIYFKNSTIEPGYYLLTPREHKGKWYILFKQNGIVMHIIPVYDRDYTPENFYKEHIPKPKLTKAQKVHMGVLSFLGKFDSTKRKEPVKSYLEVNDLDNYFVSIIIYYGGHKYSTLFRTIRL